jgi:hypothetical protein
VEHSRLALCYKGDRDYLHGTDIYNAVVDHLSMQYPVNEAKAPYFIFHTFIRAECAMFIGAGADRDEVDGPPVVEFGMSFGEKEVAGYLMETGQKITCRNPYDEDRIGQASIVKEQSVTIFEDTGFSAIEVAVAMTKRLHNALLPAPRGKWVFSKLELSRLLRNEDTIEMAISLKSNLNNRLTKSVLTARGEQIGHIYFSMAS